MARDGLFFRGAARVRPRHRTPAAALLIHGLWAGVLTLTGTYSDLLTMTAFDGGRRPRLPLLAAAPVSHTVF
jgi:APA family basic amino acid/polyamine antiporter